MIRKSYNDEIDLAGIFFSLLENKFKIITITTVFIIFGFLYFNSLNKNFIATTNIKPASTFEIEKYNVFNNSAIKKYNVLNNSAINVLNNSAIKKYNVLNKNGKNTISNKLSATNENSFKIIDDNTFNIIDDKINSEILLSLFINKIQTRELVKKAIIKSKLINKDNFQNEEDYEEAIQKNSILIIDEMNAPLINKKNKNKNKPYWSYNFLVSNKKSWRNFLEYMEKQANKEVRIFLLDSFNAGIEILNNNFKYRLEDIDQNIDNALVDYRIETENRMAFLEEQAEIARTLNIANNTLELNNFLIGNEIVTNIKSENSYYLKGYEMIEKEISLINLRKNERSFIPNIVELEKSKREILQNKEVERLELFFSTTPVADKDNFIAAKIDYDVTKYTSNQSSLSKILMISGLIGLLISFIYVFFNNLLTSRK